MRSDVHEKHIFRLPDIPTEEGAYLLDIGANIGIISVHLARMFPKNHILAFEPVPENYRVLCRIVKHYGLTNVTTYNLGLSDSNGTLHMLMPMQGKVRKQGLSHVLSPQDSAQSNGTQYTVDAFRLDDWWAKHFPQARIAGMKLDVENHESAVLRGAEKSLLAFRPWVVTELWDNQNRTETHQMMKKAGAYACKVNRNGALVAADINDPTEQNFFFIP